MKDLLDDIMRVTGERDAFFSSPQVPAVPGPPATPADLAALQTYWGQPLPPSYRAALEVYDGIGAFWVGAPLLSAKALVNGEEEAEGFEEPFPTLWKSVVIRDDDSYDAIALDLSTKGDDNEVEVVQLSVDGEERRWPTFRAFLEALLEQTTKERDQERADRANLED